MKKILIIAALLIGFTSNSFSQNIRGKVVDISTNRAIPFANVGIIGTTIGTTTDEKGFFVLKKTNLDSISIEVSYIGYQKTRKHIAQEKEFIVFTLEKEDRELNVINVVEKRSGTTLNTEDAGFSQYVSAEGIKRLACCSLAESFENNAAVDVGFTDAVTGAKQIQMLGLAGIYSQILVENQPSIRMLSTTYGLNYIPGPWLDGISISKGTSSVTHGYESITGQINIDVKKPERKERLYIEYFTNDFLKQELNINTSYRINKYLESIVLIHGESTFRKTDRNNDNFLDIPLSNLLIASNRYFFNYNEKIKSRFGIDVIFEDRIGGHKNFDKDRDFNTKNYYGAVLNTKRIQVFENTGFLINESKNGSLGVNSNFVYHQLESQFGLRSYNPTQKSANLTLVYNSELWNEKNKISFGTNANYDKLEESLLSKNYIIGDYKEKEELVLGGFAEYTFNNNKKLTVVTGIRTDYNMFFEKTIFTPRLHAKYSPWNNSAFRISLGRGLHSSNILPENINLLASSRTLVFEENLRLEDAWNYGVSYSHIWFLENEKTISYSLDFHRTDFKNRIVIDLEKNRTEAHFYNLEGGSFANSFQAEITANIFEGFETTLAYVYTDSRTTIGGELIEMPLTAKHKGLLSLHYTSKYERWKFSFTTQYHGESRLPNTKDNPIEYSLSSYSPDYFILHSQITRKFKELEIYIGCENMLNFKQENPIIGANDPFGTFFDSSIIYAPILGRQFNLGLRLTIK